MEEIGGSRNSGYIQAIMAKNAGYPDKKQKAYFLETYPDLDLTKMNKASKDITKAKVEAFYRYYGEMGSSLCLTRDKSGKDPIYDTLYTELKRIHTPTDLDSKNFIPLVEREVERKFYDY
jgi:hypothetical protein